VRAARVHISGIPVRVLVPKHGRPLHLPARALPEPTLLLQRPISFPSSFLSFVPSGCYFARRHVDVCAYSAAMGGVKKREKPRNRLC
jgi:hypothetical protein